MVDGLAIATTTTVPPRLGDLTGTVPLETAKFLLSPMMILPDDMVTDPRRGLVGVGYVERLGRQRAARYLQGTDGVGPAGKSDVAR